MGNNSRKPSRTRKNVSARRRAQLRAAAAASLRNRAERIQKAAPVMGSNSATITKANHLSVSSHETTADCSDSLGIQAPSETTQARRTTMAGHRNMAARPGVISGHNVAIPVTKTAVTTANKGVQCWGSQACAMRTHRASLRRATRRREVVTYPEAQCGPSWLQHVQDGTQTDPTTFCSSGCQTEATFPGVAVLKASAFCKRPPRKSCHRRISADKHGGDQQNAAEPPVCAIRNSLQAQEEIRPEKECNHACHFGSQSNADEASLGSRGREHMEQETEPLNVCQEHFPRRQQLVAHREMPHSCKVCDKCFSRESELVEHARMHTGEEERYPCRFCHRCYASKQSLDVHEKTHRGDPKPYVCNVCQKRFSETLLLIAHLKLHTGETLPHSCTICEKRSSREGELVEHASVHTGEERYPCRFCHRCYASKQSLDVHEKTHRGDPKPYVCNVCQKRFSETLLLIAHLKLHTGETLPHSCTICEKRSSREGELVEHASVHTIAKYYYCRFCQQRFTKKHCLYIHERTHTGDLNPFVCKICQKRLSTKKHLVDHMQDHTGTGKRSFGCSICSACFSQKCQLSCHMKTHAEGRARSYTCTTCQETFAWRCDFFAHRKQHAVPVKGGHLIEDIGKLFPNKKSSADDKKNLPGGAEGRAYACIICHKTFDQVSGLASHYCPQVSRGIRALAAQTCTPGVLP